MTKFPVSQDDQTQRQVMFVVLHDVLSRLEKGEVTLEEAEEEFKERLAKKPLEVEENYTELTVEQFIEKLQRQPQKNRVVMDIETLSPPVGWLAEISGEKVLILLPKGGVVDLEMQLHFAPPEIDFSSETND